MKAIRLIFFFLILLAFLSFSWWSIFSNKGGEMIQVANREIETVGLVSLTNELNESKAEHPGKPHMINLQIET